MAWGYSTQIGADVLVADNAGAKVTFALLEVLAELRGGPNRVTDLVLEVHSETRSPIEATSVYLEVLVRIFVPSPYVPDTYTPWTIKCDWSSGVTERIQWKTDVLESEIGVEQRRRLRNSPRREMDVDFVVHSADRRLFDAYMMGKAGGGFHVPLFWEKYEITQDALVGESTIYSDVAFTEVTSGSTIMFMGDTSFIFEILTVNSVSLAQDQLVLNNTLQQTWPKGSRCYLTKKCRIIATQSATRHADNAETVTLTFQTIEPNDFPPSFAELTAPPLVQFNPAEMNDLTYNYNRLFAELDNESGIGVRRDVALQSFMVQQVDMFARNRAQYYAIKQLLHFLQGKLQPVMVPTYFMDMQYLSYATSAATDTHIFIERSGLSEQLGATTPGRKIMGIFLRDGSNILVTLTITALVSPYVEAVQFDLPLGRNFAAKDIKRICFVQIMRQDQDDITIMHDTDTHGATELVTTFRTIADPVRLDTNYTVAYFNGTYVQDAAPPVLIVDTPTTLPPPPAPPDPPPVDVSNLQQTGNGGG